MALEAHAGLSIGPRVVWVGPVIQVEWALTRDRDTVPVRRRVNTRKAAEIAGVTERTIRNWVRLGWVEYLRTPGGGVRIYTDTLLRRPH